MRLPLPRSLFTHLGVTPRAPNIPERVQALITGQEERSERLIGWVQLGIATVFMVLFYLAPRPSDAAMLMYEPVPMAVAAYGLFTIGRLILSYRGYMPGWILVLSIMLDTMLLFGLIWSFHIQYQQPVAFVLKIPTFIYIFVFIALRALRFDHRFVLSAGAFAAIGWGVLVYFTLDSSPPEAITKSFVDYLTGNRILMGAEFDKIFTIVLMTGVLTLAIWRARQTLLTAVREESAGREIRRFLSRGVAEAITGADQAISAGVAVEREAAIVMLDIRGFTAFSSQVGPERVVEMLTSFHKRAVPLVTRHEGVVDKFMGDGMMLTFGAIKPSETAVADALRALDEIMAAAASWSRDLARNGITPILEVNGAAASGTVVFATLGNEDRLEYTVIGEAVNLAAKLEKHNKIEFTRALVPAATYKRAIEQGYTPHGGQRQLQARNVAGVGKPLDLVAVAL